MPTVLDHPALGSPTPTHLGAPSSTASTHSPVRAWLRRPRWNRFTPLQLVVLTLATIAPLIIVGSIGAALLGVISIEAMIALALVAGEDPGMITFGAMFLASPVQSFTGHSQIRVRKYLGIVFFLLALSNGVMFALESGLAAALSAPFLIAGTVALALALPLFLTSSRWSQRAMGMKRWRLLHRLTYLVALALMAHVLLMGEIGPGFVLIALGFITRLPPVKRRLGPSGVPSSVPAWPMRSRSSRPVRRSIPEGGMEPTDRRPAEREAMMSSVHELNLPGKHDDVDPPADRRIANWMLAATVSSVPIVAAVMWVLRGDFLDQIDCRTQGPYDCAYDANLAAAYGAIVGLLFLIGAAGAWALARRWPRTGAAIGSVVFVAWLAVAAMLIAATRT